MKKLVLLGTFAIVGIVASGCSKGPENAAPANIDKVAAESKHDEWWCAEHGMPEEICAQCSEKLTKEFKAKGDWCKEHDRPDSQCFKCHPELEAKFAKTYEAKYGKIPPKPTEGIEDHAEKKN